MRDDKNSKPPMLTSIAALERYTHEEMIWIDRFNHLSTRHQKWMYLLTFERQPKTDISIDYFFDQRKNSNPQDYLIEKHWGDFEQKKLTQVDEAWINGLDKRKLLFVFLEIHVCFLKANEYVKEERKPSDMLDDLLSSDPEDNFDSSYLKLFIGENKRSDYCYGVFYKFDFFSESNLDSIKDKISCFLFFLKPDQRRVFLEKIDSSVVGKLSHDDLAYFMKSDKNERVDFLYNYVFKSFDNFKKYKRDDMLSKFRELELMTLLSENPVHSLEDKFLISKVIIERISRLEHRNLFIKNLMSAAYQKEHRDKQKTKTKYHLALTKDSKKKLSKMAGVNNKSEAIMVNEIIQEYYELNYKKGGRDIY